MIPTDFAKEEKLWKKLMSENDSILDGYFPTIAELSRWLQACEGNALEAEKRILATLKWRRANGIDELLSTDEWELPAKLKEQHKVQLVALKGQIQPVWYIPVGTANFKDLLRQFGTEVFIKGPLMTLEASISLMRGLSSVFYEKGVRNSYCQGYEKGEGLGLASTASVVSASSLPVLRHVLVLDLRGLALAQVLDTGVIRLLTQLASLHEAHYPETLGEAVLISSRQTAYITRMALSLVKPFLAERTRAKIKLVSDGPDLQQQLATAFSDSDVLNSILNAMKMTDNNTEKKTSAADSSSSISERSTPIKEPAVDVGGSVPFLTRPELLDTIMCRQKIGPGCKLCIKFRVTNPEQEMRWRFRALKGKLAFVIYRQKIKDTEITSTNQQATNNEIKPEYNQLYASFSKKDDYEVVKESMTVMSSKAYCVGKIPVEPSFDYYVILTNPSQLFPSATILHTIEVVSNDTIDPPYQIFTCPPTNSEIEEIGHQKPKVKDENREAKIEDLLTFVCEITKSDLMSKECKKKLEKTLSKASPKN